MRKIKRDDEVIVVAGRDKGKRGKVVRVLAEDRLIVSGINMIKKHQKPNPQLGVAGGIVEKKLRFMLRMLPFTIRQQRKLTA